MGEKDKTVHIQNNEDMNTWQPALMATEESNNPKTSVNGPAINTDLIFIPTWDNRPKDLPPVLSLNGTPILTHQNTSSIIAAPGLGKSSICESVLATYLSPTADCLGFTVWGDCKGLLYIDFERTNIDVWNSFYRTCAGVQE